MKAAELCAGYGGLAMAARMAGWPIHLAWVSEVDADASKVLAHHHPDVPNLKDMTAVDWDRVEKVDVLAGGIPCFVAGTKILTRDGYTSIEDIEVGDEVLTHAGRWRPVTCVMARDDAELWEVKSGQVITTTPEHPFYARMQGRHWNNDRRRYERTFSDPGWVEAKDLLTRKHRVGHVLPPAAEPENADGAWWWVVGRYLADGHRMKRHVTGAGNPCKTDQGTVVISCGAGKEEELRLNIKRAGLHVIESPARTATKFIITGQRLYPFLADYGKGAANKRLTPEALALPPELAEELLQGWLSGDGHRTEQGWAGVTTSKELALGLVLLAHRARSVFAPIHLTIPPPTKVIEGRTVNQRPWWRIDIPNRNRIALVDGDYAWRFVADSRPAGTTGRVYNISVAEDESYIADGVIVHNCQGWSLAGKRNGSDDERDLWPVRKLDDDGNPRRGALDAIRVLRPRVFLLENVASLVSAEGGRPFATILTDLHELGYNAGWVTVGACRVGACHHRHRVFLIATLGEVLPPEGLLFGVPLSAAAKWPTAGLMVDGQVWPLDVDVCGAPVADSTMFPTPTASAYGSNQSPSAGAAVRPSLEGVVQLLPTPTASREPGKHGMSCAEYAQKRLDSGRRNLEDAIATLLPTPNAAMVANRIDTQLSGDGRDHPNKLGWAISTLLPTPRASDTGTPGRRASEGFRPPLSQVILAQSEPARFGPYERAVRRHEAMLGGPAPEPTEPSRTGTLRLSAAFPEWMQSLPPGWLTDLIAEKGDPRPNRISRNAAIKLAGNGVNPVQGALAIRLLSAYMPYLMPARVELGVAA